MESLVEYTQSDRTIALIGASGVGKSTLANWLLGGEMLATSAVRAHDSRGWHTTTARYLMAIPGGGTLIDTPGLRSLGVLDSEEGVSKVFADIEDLAVKCRFRDCRHESEPGCAVTGAIGEGVLDEDRLADMRKLERELAHQRRKDNPSARADLRPRRQLNAKSRRVEEKLERKPK